MVDPEDRRPAAGGITFDAHTARELGGIARWTFTVRESRVLWGRLVFTEHVPSGEQVLRLTLFDEAP